MTTPFKPQHPIEQSLLALQNGEMDDATFMQQLLEAEFFMPILDEHKIAGLQTSKVADPLTIEGEEGYKILVLFTAPERGKAFLSHYPGYEGGLLAEASWILERIGSGIAISINPGLEVGLDLEPAMVEQLVGRVLAQKAAE
jgi:hypothetical protein